MKYERGITHIAVVEFISCGSVFHKQFNVAFRFFSSERMPLNIMNNQNPNYKLTFFI